MPLENLTIRRACLHEVHRRADDRSVVQPTFADGLLALNARGRSVFESRVLAAFKSGAKCLQMDIVNHGADGVAALGAAIVSVNDGEFLQKSRQFANLLASAQKSRQYPGGLVVVFDGTVGYPARPFFAIMKAEMHDAFLKSANLQATFVDSVFLSPKTKLYKIGIFSAQSDPPEGLPNGWVATVYDSQLTETARDGAALYFHEGFLGLAFPENSAQRTKIFYQKTREFIASAAIEEEEKIGLYNGLYAYLKLNRSQTLQVSDFAETYMEEGVGDAYRGYMRQARFTEDAVQKDIAEISGRMRTRKLKFSDQIVLSGPAQAISDLVDVETLDSADGQPRTRLTIRGRLESQT